MALSLRRRRRVVRSLRRLVFDLCITVGGLAGLYVGLQAPTAAPECRSSSCLSEGLVAAAMPILVPAGLGLLAGATLGVLLARLIPDPRGPAPRWIVARYAGACASCRTTVARGDRVRHDAGARIVYCAGCSGSGRFGD